MDPVFVCRDLGGVALLGAFDAVSTASLPPSDPMLRSLTFTSKVEVGSSLSSALPPQAANTIAAAQANAVSLSNDGIFIQVYFFGSSKWNFR